MTNLVKIISQYHPDILRMSEELGISPDLETIKDPKVWDEISSYPFLSQVVLSKFANRLNPTLIIECQKELNLVQFMEFAYKSDYHCVYLPASDVICLNKYTGDKEEVIVPAKISVLGSHCFEDLPNLKKVVLHTNITYVHPDWCVNCPNYSKDKPNLLKRLFLRRS